MTIKNAAQVVGIRPSSARMILRRYQLTGEIFEAKNSQKKREI